MRTHAARRGGRRGKYLIIFGEGMRESQVRPGGKGRGGGLYCCQCVVCMYVKRAVGGLLGRRRRQQQQQARSRGRDEGQWPNGPCVHLFIYACGWRKGGKQGQTVSHQTSQSEITHTKKRRHRLLGLLALPFRAPAGVCGPSPPGRFFGEHGLGHTRLLLLQRSRYFVLPIASNKCLGRTNLNVDPCLDRQPPRSKLE